ncbi:MAG: hypothetical protein ACI93N_001505 [Flavobacteriaceae bacterium]|jgi:hypothetical protein
MILTQVETGLKFMTLQNNNIIQNSNKRLSVQLSLSGLSFLVTNSETKEVYSFSEKKYKRPITPEKLLLDLKSSFEQNNELNDTFKEVAVIYATSLYSLVPSTLFDSSKTSEYLKFNSKILANDFIAFDTLGNHNITVVYIPFININNYLFDRFGNFSYYHSSTLLIEHLLNKEKSYTLPKVYINVTNNIFDFIAVKNGKLIICNSYEFTTPEDFIYFILFCLEQLKMNPDTVDLYISGSIEKEEATYKILYNYIRNITFYNVEEKLILTEKESLHQNLLLKLL